jgi:hypothetical protein
MRESPFEVFYHHTNPIEGWKPVGSMGCKVGYMSDTIDTLPGYKPISDDVQDYVNKLPVDTTRYDPKVNSDRRWCYWIQDMTFYEDGTGQHAVSFTIPHDGTDWGYVLVYDKNNKRVRAVRYVAGHYMS